MYYDYDKISSYNATFNMIITNRGFGKTYGAKKRAINKFLKKGEQFIYVRRYKSIIHNWIKLQFNPICTSFTM